MAGQKNLNKKNNMLWFGGETAWVFLAQGLPSVVWCALLSLLCCVCFCSTAHMHLNSDSAQQRRRHISPPKGYWVKESFLVLFRLEMVQEVGYWRATDEAGSLYVSVQLQS